MTDDPDEPEAARAVFTVREGTISEALEIEAAIPEFAGANDPERYAERLEGRRTLILIAEQDGLPIGFKVGYEDAPGAFYSWLGGVVPHARGRGVATALRVQQQRWALAAGYRRVRVKSKNRFPHMLRLLIGAGYQVTGTEGTGDDLKISFELTL